MSSETNNRSQTHRSHHPTSGVITQLGDDLRSFTVGTDAKGYDHHYWRPADAVVVYDDSTVSRVEYLDGRLLADWVKFVTQNRGWQSPGQLANIGIEADKRRKEEQ